jgi:hypothetical protein
MKDVAVAAIPESEVTGKLVRPDEADLATLPARRTSRGNGRNLTVVNPESWPRTSGGGRAGRPERGLGPAPAVSARGRLPGSAGWWSWASWTRAGTRRGAWPFGSGQLPVVARRQRLRAGFGLNYAAPGLVADLLDRIAALETALRQRPVAVKVADQNN